MNDKFMKEALKEAKKAYLKDEVPVGCVLVKDNKIISRAHNLREKKSTAISHAEILCIDKACKKLKTWRLENTVLYVTLEPCIMCAGAIIQARIDKVVFGTYDKKNGAVGSISNVFELETTHKVKYDSGIMNDECSEILSNFFKELRNKKR
jgi:tRNA(adenine34) deaminase